ncbi:MAG: hypothetical protein IJ618_05970 [Prevotella sp.]|nr:hypothetical protein [Prevotella sp.]
MNTIPKIIDLNPFRIFGVYANSPKKDIVANKGRITAFLKVKRSIDFPLDLNGILSPIERTIDMLNEAEASLAIAKDQIKVAQFWFFKNTPLDDIALNHLIAGDMIKAKEIWSKQESLSSLQNKIVCYLIENKPWLALKDAEKLYGKYGDTFINKVDANCTIHMTSQDLLHQFIDTLGTEIGMQKLLGYELSDETKAYISSQTIGPLVNKILSEVEKTKKVEHKNPKARLEAARNLVRSTKESFTSLKSVLTPTDPQYQLVADKLGLEILQCGIDYFNNSGDEDKHQTAMKIQKYASSIVVGSLAKQRCDENVKILQKIIDELPPSEVSIYEQYIKDKLSRFIVNVSPRLLSMDERELDRLKELLINCGPYLGSIKEILGVNHPYYLKSSTDLVNLVLSRIIDIINNSMGSINRSLTYNRDSLIEKMREAIKNAWLLTLMMDEFDIEPSFNRDRYLPNRKILKDIVNQASIYAGKPEPVDMRPEKQMLSEIKTISDCEHFLSIFPKSKHKNEVEEKRRTIRFKTCNCIKDCHDLEKDYPNRKAEIDKLREQIIYRELERCETTDDYESFINNYPNCKYITEAQERLDNLIRTKRRKRIVYTIIWTLLALFVAGLLGYSIWSSNRRRELEKQAAKQAEYNLYNNIVNKGDTSSCARFLESYPNSNYIGEVKKVLVEYEYHHLTSLDDCLDFISNHPHSVFATSIDSMISERAENLKKEMLGTPDDCDLYKMWEIIHKYYSFNNKSLQSALAEITEHYNHIKEIQEAKAEKARKDSIKKVEEAKKREEYEKYGTDANAWKTASSANTITAYQDYLKRYPKGKYVETANKKIIDLEVQNVINSGDYGYLPSSQKVSYGTGKYSTINLSSRCNQTITIMYSGVKSMKIVLSPYQSRKAVLPSGTYKVVATSPGVRSFYGTEKLTGGDYESEYYIETRRY